MGRLYKTNKKAGVLSVLICILLTVGALSGCVEETEPEPELNNIVDTAIESDDFNILVDAVVAAGLDGTLSDETKQFTVFAPTDEAFEALDSEYLAYLVNNDTATLEKILTYHVIPGTVMSTDLSDGMRVKTVQGKHITVTIQNGNVYIDNAMVTTADIECSNGVIHVIDTVIVPKNNIVETAIEEDDFETLVTAVVAADLADTLGNEDAQFTVFAPTDAAFEALDPEFLADLVNNDTANLTKILTYHVVLDKVMSTDLSDNMTVETVEGTTITITIDDDGNVFVNDAQVILADIECSNGVIHVINAVLVP
ncbi:MAG: fasciclin domain-containing protein [Thermoplasmatota archaeon]